MMNAVNYSTVLQPERWAERYDNYLNNYASSRIPQSMVADLVQETYLAALKSLDAFKFQAHERTWLVSILRHKIIDYYRKANSKKAQCTYRALKASDFEEQYGWSWERIISIEDTPDQTMHLLDLKNIIVEGIGHLSPSEKKVLALKMQGMTTREICQSLNINSNNCWVLVSRSRRKLKEYMAAQVMQ